MPIGLLYESQLTEIYMTEGSVETIKIMLLKKMQTIIIAEIICPNLLRELELIEQTIPGRRIFKSYEDTKPKIEIKFHLQVSEKSKEPNCITTVTFPCAVTRYRTCGGRNGHSSYKMMSVRLQS